MKIKIFGLLLAGALALTSCDDFLTETPKYSLTTDNAIRDAESARNAITGMYARYYYYSYLGGRLYGPLTTMPGIWDYDQTFVNMSYTQSSNDYTVNGVWSGLYGVINACNFAIEGLNKIDAAEFDTPTEKDELLGQAYCFRGFCNLHLLWLYGHWFEKADSPYGIIYRDQVSNLSNVEVDRSTVGESYDYIIADLKLAEEMAPAYSSPLYLSKEFAKAMHAKLLMRRGWEGDNAEALSIVNALLADKSSKWQMETDLAKVYEDGWASTENCFTRYLGDRVGISSGTAGYEWMYSYGIFYNNKFHDIVQEWLENDERYDINWGVARPPEQWDTKNDTCLVKLYHRGKIAGKDDKYATYPMRYIELYMMKAELLALTNPSDIQGALAPINEMRSRYTNPIMAPITDVTNHQELMDAIYKEIVCALIMENESCWFASLRFEHDGKPWIYTLKEDVNFSTNQYCWPIPDDELKTHSNTIEQNPGLE